MIEIPGEYGGLRCMGHGCTNLTASDLCKVCTIIARAEKAEAEVERLKQGYLAAGVNSLSWHFMEAINKLFEPCFGEPKP